DQHQERDHAVLPEAALLFDAHASLTALVIAPNTPSDAQMRARPPATPTWTRICRNASSCVVMNSNCVGKYRKTNGRTPIRSCSSAVIEQRSEMHGSRNGKNDRSA